MWFLFKIHNMMKHKRGVEICLLLLYFKDVISDIYMLFLFMLMKIWLVSHVRSKLFALDETCCVCECRVVFAAWKTAIWSAMCEREIAKFGRFGCKLGIRNIQSNFGKLWLIRGLLHGGLVMLTLKIIDCFQPKPDKCKLPASDKRA